jgi:hypothetical protein
MPIHYISIKRLKKQFMRALHAEGGEQHAAERNGCRGRGFHTVALPFFLQAVLLHRFCRSGSSKSGALNPRPLDVPALFFILKSELIRELMSLALWSLAADAADVKPCCQGRILTVSAASLTG